ncbi:DUF1629 domain-containing protein [Achromobacter xylosoxidans]
MDPPRHEYCRATDWRTRPVPRAATSGARAGERGLPRDFEALAGIWVVSEALRQVFLRVDPEAFAFVSCDFTLADGSPVRSTTSAMCCAR